MEKEYLIPGSTPVRAIRGVWDPERPTSQIRIETAIRIGTNDIDHRSVVILPRELKFLYEQTVGKQYRVEAEAELARLRTQVQNLESKVQVPVSDLILDATGPTGGAGKATTAVRPGRPPKQLSPPGV